MSESLLFIEYPFLSKFPAWDRIMEKHRLEQAQREIEESERDDPAAMIRREQRAQRERR